MSPDLALIVFFSFHSVCTRWFIYDRDKLWLVYTQIVPVIFKPPCRLQRDQLSKDKVIFVSALMTSKCVACCCYGISYSRRKIIKLFLISLVVAAFYSVVTSAFVNPAEVCLEYWQSTFAHITCSVVTYIKFQLSDIFELSKTLLVVQLFTLCHPNMSKLSNNETSKRSKDAVQSEKWRVATSIYMPPVFCASSLNKHG